MTEPRVTSPDRAGAGGQRADENGNAPDLGRVEFLTVAEVAALMRVSKMTVYRLVHSGELPAVRVGGSLRVPREAVRDCLRGGTRGDEFARLTAVGTRGELVDVCARHADALAAQTEQAGRRVAVQIEHLSRGDLASARRSAFDLAATLRVLAASLGELHTVLDEVGHESGGVS